MYEFRVRSRAPVGTLSASLVTSSRRVARVAVLSACRNLDLPIEPVPHAFITVYVKVAVRELVSDGF